MKMNLGNVEVRVEMKKRADKRMTKLEKAYNNERAIKHYKDNKERVTTDYFFGI